MTSLSRFFGVAAVTALPFAASAVDLTLPMPGEHVQRSVVHYRCGGSAELKVDYINAGDVSFAVMPVRSERRAFVNVVSGSGVRYASGPYIWWIKGQQGTLSDDRQPSSPNILDCQETRGG